MMQPIEIEDSVRLTRAMESASTPTTYIIVSYPKGPDGTVDESGRWLGGHGPRHLGTRVPDGATQTTAPTAEDVARVHAEASAAARLESCDYGTLAGRDLITAVATDSVLVAAAEIRGSLGEERQLWARMVSVYADQYGPTDAAHEAKRALHEQYNVDVDALIASLPLVTK